MYISMIFRIVNFNKELDLYNVISNEGEQKNVTSFQIINVMIQGYKFDNAYPTKKGFGIKTPNGTKFIQVRLDRNTQIKLINYLEYQKKLEEEKQRQLKQKQEQERIKREQEQIRINQEQAKRQQKIQYSKPKIIDTPSRGNRTTKIQGSNRNQKILYRGELYISHEALCRKFNRDLSTFEDLRRKGYSIDESLGIKPLRPESELVSPKQLQRMLDSMAIQRGEF